MGASTSSKKISPVVDGLVTDTLDGTAGAAVSLAVVCGASVAVGGDVDGIAEVLVALSTGATESRSAVPEPVSPEPHAANAQQQTTIRIEPSRARLHTRGLTSPSRYEFPASRERIVPETALDRKVPIGRSALDRTHRR